PESDARVAQLEKENFMLKTRIKQLEDTVTQLDQQLKRRPSAGLGAAAPAARSRRFGCPAGEVHGCWRPPLNNPNESSGSSTNPRDRLLKSTPEPKSTLPPVPLPADRRDVDLDSEPRWRLGDEPFREDADEPVLPSRDFNSGGGGSWFSGRMEHSVRESDGTVRRTVTTVGPDGRRSSVTTVETPDGRVRPAARATNGAPGSESELAERQRAEERAKSDEAVANLIGSAPTRSASMEPTRGVIARRAAPRRWRASISDDDDAAVDSDGRDESNGQQFGRSENDSLKDTEAALAAASARREKLQAPDPNRRLSILNRLRWSSSSRSEQPRDAFDAERQVELDSRLAELASARERATQLESRLARCDGAELREARSAAAALEAAKTDLLLTLRSLKSGRSRPDTLGEGNDPDADADGDELSVSFRDFVSPGASWRRCARRMTVCAVGRRQQLRQPRVCGGCGGINDKR
uniref:Cnn_1N domain-containing protein n=1 Tax=Macrostomum lignano TaxID=282301 RepID=A0A1I8FJV8_9PLAT